MQSSWNGGDMVVPHMVYLGIALCSRDAFGPICSRRPPLSAGTRNLCTNVIWARGLGRMTQRSLVLQLHICSLGLRAHQWNTYLVSCELYPSQAVPPDSSTCEALVRSFRDSVRPAATVPWYLWPHLLLVGGLGGAPRCPVASALTGSVIAALTDGLWGAPELRRRAQDIWQRTVTWARQTLRDEPGGQLRAEGWQRRLETAAQGILALADSGDPLDLATVRRRGPHIYRGILATQRGAAVERWLSEVSARRRFWPTRGQEWAALGSCRSVTAAGRLLLLLSGTALGGLARRNAASRLAFPRLCCECQAASPELTWITPGPEQPGWSWCRRCAPVEAGALPGLVAHRLGLGPPSPDPATPASLRRQPWQLHRHRTRPCPLCGFGEHSAEHLLVWCPCLAICWTSLTGDRCRLLDALQPNHAQLQLA